MPPRASKGLDSLARLYGIESVFTDELGRRQTVSVDNLRNVLTLLGAPDGSPSHIRDATERASLSTWLTVLTYHGPNETNVLLKNNVEIF